MLRGILHNVEGRTVTQAPVLDLQGISLRRQGVTILDGVDWTVRRGQRWVVLGPNGAGKTSLMHVAASYEPPTTGTLDLLGGRAGETDVRDLRLRLGYVGQGIAKWVPPVTEAVELVAMGAEAKLRRLQDTATPEQLDRAHALLEELGVDHRARTRWVHLSVGERQRVLLARALMGDPELLLLDEPSAGLDVAGREYLVSMLGRLAAQEAVGGIVFVTHHVEEVPRGFDHALLLRGGRVHAAGPVDEMLTAERLSTLFGLDLDVHRVGGRYMATAPEPTTTNA